MAADYWRSSQANQWLLDPWEIRIARAEDVRYAGSEDKVAAAIICLANGISQLAKRLHLRQRITATATVFFHRFYAVPPNALCNTDPCLVATACVYAASKVEETPLHIRSVHQEAHKMWQELGHPSFPPSSTDIAEMEFYLLRDLNYHLILHHPYRSLMTIVGTVGKAALTKAELESKSRGKAGGATTSQKSVTGLGLQADVLGVGSSRLGTPSFDMAALSSVGQASPAAAAAGSARDDASGGEDEQTEEDLFRRAMTAGDHGLPIARAEELDQDVVQMAWFLLNDTYRHPAMHLVYPPYILAVAAIYLALVLHEKSREKLMASTKRMQDRRKRSQEEKEAVSAQKLKRAKDEDDRGTRVGNASGKDAGSGSLNADHAGQHSISAPGSQQDMASVGASRGLSGTASPRNAAGLPPRPSHLPFRPGPPTPTAGSGTQSPRATGTPTPTPAATSPQPVSGLNGGGSLTSSAAHGAGSGRGVAAAASAAKDLGPTPPPDILTFLATLNLAPTTQLASCIQGMLDGYATWASCQREIEGPEGSKRVMGWLTEWRTSREEELRVLELEKARDEAEAEADAVKREGSASGKGAGARPS
ncbi:unnamed protein product [Parajaminaea phylloscopi]